MTREKQRLTTRVYRKMRTRIQNKTFTKLESKVKPFRFNYNFIKTYHNQFLTYLYIFFRIFLRVKFDIFRILKVKNLVTGCSISH